VSWSSIKKNEEVREMVVGMREAWCGKGMKSWPVTTIHLSIKLQNCVGTD
jgi:hypothetical protein